MNICRRIVRYSYTLIKERQPTILHALFAWKHSHLLRSSIMSQRSITSFFNKTPKKSEDVENVSPGNDNPGDVSPGNNIMKQNVKRQRIKSEENESSSPPLKKSATDNTKETLNSKNTPKELKKKTPKSTKKTTPKFKIKLKETTSLSDKDSETCNSDESPKNKTTDKENAEKIEITPVKNKVKNEDQSDIDTPVKISKNKNKRQRLVSSSSENSDIENKDLKKSAIATESETNNDSEKNTKVKQKVVEKHSHKAAKKNTSPKEVKKQEDVIVKKESKDESPRTTSTIGSFFTSTKDKNKQNNSDKERNYNPTKSKYHPIEDAPWIRGDKVPYLAFAKTLEAIEATSARLKIVEILSNYFRSVIVLSPADLLPSIYMCLNKLAPAYESLELGVAETYLMKAIAQSTGRTLAQIKAEASKVGDLGLVAEQCRSTQRMMFQPAPLTVPGVFVALKEVANMTGQASMAKKVGKIQSLFVACRQSEARYFIRSLAGKLRIGLAEQSVLQSLAQACATTPPCQSEDNWPPPILDASKGLSPEDFKAKIDEQALIVKTTYCNCPNYDMIIPVILKHGVAELPQHCRLTPGIPLKPMLAHPTKGIHEVFQRFENLKFTCEWKYDGERAQIHLPSNPDSTACDLTKASIFSRNQENNTSKYPDVLGRLKAALKPEVMSCVLDCEAVAWDKERKQILPFQVLSTRKRKDASAAEIKVQVCLFIFDLLYLNGQSLITEPLAERRRLLMENFNQVEGEWHFATSKDCSTMEEVQEFLEESIKGSCEGLMVKTLAGKDATYEIAKRSKNWLKLKKDYLDGVGDTLDVVVIGGYLGRGKRAGVYGGFLLACHDRDADEYQSVCKIGTGFTEEDLAKHSETLNAVKIDEPRNYYRYDASHEPDVWFSPAQVWEVRCADLSLSPAHRAAIGLVDPDKGISLRFPRFVRVREDKTPEEATSARQVADIYLNQDQVKNQGSTGSKNMEDDFY